MSAQGLEVFDKTVQTTNIWLDEIMDELGPDRHLAWHVLGAVLRSLRDRLPIALAVHLGSQLPILIRGAYYDRWTPRDEPLALRSRDEFLHHVSQSLGKTRSVDLDHAVQAVFRTMSNHVTDGQVRKVRDCLPDDLVAIWSQDAPGAAAPMAHQVSALR